MSAPFRLAGVIGWPVAHSRSPLLHGYWLRRYGIAGAYVPLPVAPDALPAALRGLAALGFAGCNVTVPHKEQAARLVDRLDPAAARIGAVNTVVVGPDGALEGRNTDAAGFWASLQEAAPGFSPASALVLGAGGATRAVLWALLQAGVSRVLLANRTRARAQAVAADFPGVAVADWSQRAAALEGIALVVNATTQGMHGQPPLDLPLDALPLDAVVADIVYTPLETPLLRAAAARGNRIAPGLPMLLHQARPGFAAWFGVEPEVTDELRALIAASVA